MRIPVLAALALAGCHTGFDEWADCRGQWEPEALLDISLAPDFTVELPERPAGDWGEPWEDGGKVFLEVWDCVDLAWWTGVQPQKVLQIWRDDDQCELYDRVWIEYYDCHDLDTPESPYRDRDGDGRAPFQGDCDDADPAVGGDYDGDGTSDCVDDDGDGLTEAQGDIDDRDAAVGLPEDTAGDDTGAG